MKRVVEWEEFWADIEGFAIRIDASDEPNDAEQHRSGIWCHEL